MGRFIQNGDFPICVNSLAITGIDPKTPMQSVIDEILGDFVCIVFIGPTRSISFSYTSHSSWVFQSSRLNAFPRSCLGNRIFGWISEAAPVYTGDSRFDPCRTSGSDPRGSDLVSKEFAGTRSVGPFDDSNQATHSSCGSPCIRTTPRVLVTDRHVRARARELGRGFSPPLTPFDRVRSRRAPRPRPLGGRSARATPPRGLVRALPRVPRARVERLLIDRGDARFRRIRGPSSGA